MRLGLDRGAVGAGSGWTDGDGSSRIEGGGVGGYPCVGGGSRSVGCFQPHDLRRASRSFVVAAKELLVLAFSLQRLPSYLLHVKQQILI